MKIKIFKIDKIENISSHGVPLRDELERIWTLFRTVYISLSFYSLHSQ